MCGWVEQSYSSPVVHPAPFRALSLGPSDVCILLTSVHCDQREYNPLTNYFYSFAVYPHVMRLVLMTLFDQLNERVANLRKTLMWLPHRPTMGERKFNLASL